MNKERFFELIQCEYNKVKKLRPQIYDNLKRVKPDENIKKQGFFIIPTNYWFDSSPIFVNFHLNIPNDILPHKHNFFEIIYVYKKEIINHVDGKIINMKQGDICLLNINALHRIEPIDDDTIVLNILMEKSLFENAFFCVLNGNEAVFNFFADSLYRKNQEQNYMLFPFVDLPADRYFGSPA